MAESVQESVRIPAKLAEFIDTFYVENGSYSSRADFVSCALHYFYENSLYNFARYAETARKLKKENVDLGSKYSTSLSIVKMMFLNTTRVNRVDMFEGEKIVVLLRLPPEFVRSYTRFINETGIFKSKTDFFHNAISAYMDVQYYAERVAKGIHSRDAIAINMAFSEPSFPNMASFSDVDKVLNHEDWEPYSVTDTEKEDWLDDYMSPEERENIIKGSSTNF